ncbi:hypothetical protein GYB59_14455 [bacterium]|nr:hypothetical protein [bacterium]
MSTGHDVPFKLPQSGWRLDDEFYKPLGIEQATFRRRLRECGVPFREFGNSVVLNAADFYPALPKFLQPNEGAKG